MLFLFQNCGQTLMSASKGFKNNKGISVPTDQLRWLADDELNEVFDDFVELNVCWLRIDIYWNSIQPTSSNSYSWTEMERLVTAARNRNIQVLGILHGTPTWAAASVGSNVPANASDFANFARQVAIHYSHPWGFIIRCCRNELSVNDDGKF